MHSIFHGPFARHGFGLGTTQSAAGSSQLMVSKTFGDAADGSPNEAQKFRFAKFRKSRMMSHV